MFRNKLNSVILTLYLFLIVFAFVYVFITDKGIVLLVFTPLLLIICWFIANRLLYQTEKAHIIKPTNIISGTMRPADRLLCFVLSMLGTFVILMIWFIAYRPGSYQGDCLFQFEQAMTGHYNDWHPVWQTILTYTIPLTITRGSTWAPTFFQMIAFSLTMGYIILTVYEYAGTAWAVGTFIYIMINPYTGQMFLYPWKDCPFAMAGGIAMAMVMRIYFTDGKWADQLWKIIMLGVVLANCTIFRHNAILYTALIVFGLLFYIPWKRWLVLLLSFIIFIAAIKGPVYSLLDVEHEPQDLALLVALPMTVIGNSVKDAPELLDEEIVDFAYRVAPREAWENTYQTGNYGVLLYSGTIDKTPIDEAGALGVVEMAAKCIIDSPRTSFKSIFAVTDIVYGLDQRDEGYIGSQIETNYDGIVYQGNAGLADVLMTYYKLFRLHGFNYFRQFAFALLALLTVLLAKCDLRNRNDLKKVLLVIGIFVYSFGTMLLLVAADSRFFYIDYLVCPMAVIILLSDRDYIDVSHSIKEKVV